MERIKRFLGSRTFAALAALTSGLLTLLSDYPNPVAVLAWIAPVPVLVAALRRGFPDAVWLGLLYVSPAYFGSGVLTMPGFIPMPVRIGYFLAYIALFELLFVATVYLVRRTGIAATGWIHAAVVTVAGLIQEFPFIGHFLPAAGTQVHCDVTRSVASLGGDYLVGSWRCRE